MLLQHVLPGLAQTPEAFSLRPYQENCTDAVLYGYLYSNRNKGLIGMATGGGKTLCSLNVLERLRAIDRQTTGLLIAPSIDLAHQNYAQARRFFPHEEVGLVQAENRFYQHPIIVATTDTLANPLTRKRLLLAQGNQKFTFVWIDEAHAKTLGILREILDDLEDPYALRLGVSATPYRGDGRTLNPVFPDGFFYNIEISELVAEDWLLPFEVHRIETTKKDRHKAALEAWYNIAEQERTIVFSASVPDATKNHAHFKKSGVGSALITSKTSRDRREQIYGNFSCGRTPVMNNWGVLTTGVDFPEARVAFIMRYAWMKGELSGVHKQAVGRIIRLSKEQNSKKKVGKIVYFLTPGCDWVPDLEGLSFGV